MATNVSGPLRLVTDQPASLVQVMVRAPRPRPYAGGMVVDFTAPASVTDGVVSFPCVPGPAVLSVTHAGVPQITVSLVVPGKPAASLEECMQAAGLADNATQSVLEDLARRIVEGVATAEGAAGTATAQAETATEQARVATTKAEDADASAKAAKTSEQNAKSSETNAAESASAAETSEQNSANSATAAKTSETNAASSTSAAKTSETNAAQSASAAKTSETNAANSANAAKTSETNAAGSASAARSEADKAAQSASAAKTSEANAKTSETNSASGMTEATRQAGIATTKAGEADASAKAAKSSEERAATIAGSTRWVGTRLEVNGQLSPDLKGDLPVVYSSTPPEDKNVIWVNPDEELPAQTGTPGGGGASGPVSWESVTGKPAEFTPAAHTHTTAQVTGLDEALAGKASATHVHGVGDVTGLQGALDGKALTSHSHAIADTTGLQSALDGKAPTSHTHTASQISDVTTTGRNVLTASSQAAARSAIGAGTSNLAIGTTATTAAAGNHTHTPASIGAAPTSHTHTIGDVTGLQSALDGKVNASQIQIVETLPASPTPGTVYITTV